MSTTPQGQSQRVRCSACGTSNTADAGDCVVCQAPLSWFAQGAFDNQPAAPSSHQQALAPVAACDSGAWAWQESAPGGQLPSRQSQRCAAAPATAPKVPKLPGDLVGRVILVEPPYQERPDFDWFQLFTKILWLMLLVASPFLLLYGLLVFGGVLPAILALLAMGYLVRFLKPANLLPLLHLHAILSPSRRSEIETVPVRNLRVRDDDDVEWMVRMKGQITLGNVATDDLVSLWGRWRGGTLSVTHGYNHRTRSDIQVEQSGSWLGFALTLAFILFLVAVFWGPTATLVRRFGGGL